MALRPISVTELNTYLEKIISMEPLLRSVVVKGEISSVTYTARGIIYFGLSDNESKIDCVIWKDRAENLKDELKKGDEVIVTGGLRVYKAMGQVQLAVTSVEIQGEGEAAIAFEKLKAKLLKEGLFDEKYKKPLPEFPDKIGIVTSGSGAAVDDIKKTIKERTVLTDAIIFPVPVQGQGAAEEISAMLDYINENYKGELDLIILGRGGGSPEDLAAFNDEGLARAIFRSEIPIISAVGHEIDFSISDFVADTRGATPTGAAAMAVREDRELMDRAIEGMDILSRGLSNKLIYEELNLDRYRDGLKNALRERFAEEENQIERAMLVLKGGDVKAALDRGYAIIRDNDGKLIKSAKDLKIEREYYLTLADGSARAVVTGKEEKDAEA